MQAKRLKQGKETLAQSLLVVGILVGWDGSLLASWIGLCRCLRKWSALQLWKELCNAARAAYNSWLCTCSTFRID
eukprot:544418-Prorocentrum_lima.AAC.1